MAVHRLLRLEQAKQNKTNDSLTFEADTGPRKGLLPSQLQPETGAKTRALVSEQSATKCPGLQRVTKCHERTDTLTFIWSVMSRLPSTSEHYRLNGRKASDWLRLYAPNWAVSDFAGRVRLMSSDRRDQFKPYGSLFCPNWREVRRS